MPTPPKGRGKPQSSRPDLSKDLDRDGDIDLADDRTNDLNRDGRIDANDSELNDVDNDTDIDAADRALEDAPAESQSVGASLGWSKGGGGWNRPDAPAQGTAAPKQGIKS
ncbi:MAG TPA: hypothetical protein VD994_07460 [Prosthecobacter sp.]|nr:hypothetical protein [Prosthecobacter sp.]